jgi:hypothetical protein
VSRRDAENKAELATELIKIFLDSDIEETMGQGLF